MIRTRIAPSPTGNLHIGTARTALFNYLFAKKIGGKFIIRIEDTDLERSDKKYEENILEGLAWLGIEADESPIVGGKFGPYKQSERIEIYRSYLEKLLAESKAFYCFHSKTELENEKREQIKTKRLVLHICDFRNIHKEEAKKKKKSAETSIIRFKSHLKPQNAQLVFDDIIRGQVHSFANLLGDFSIAKSLDVPLYNFAVVVDDETMEISHVIRGEDHISNTPKQLLLIEALGFRKPEYAHLPLILGADRSKLSKRHGTTSVDEYKKMGYLPEALFNFMALLGWNPGDDREILPKKDELIKLFSIEKVQKSGAIFDVNKLDWMNGEYIRQKTVPELTRLCLPYLEKAGLIKGQTDYTEKVVALEQPRLKKLSDLPDRADYFFKEPVVNMNLLRWKDMKDEEIIQSLEKSIHLLKENKSLKTKDIEKIFMDGGQKMGDRGLLLWPLRAALSGKKASAGPFEIISILGIEKSIKRLEDALQSI